MLHEGYSSRNAVQRIRPNIENRIQYASYEGGMLRLGISMGSFKTLAFDKTRYFFSPFALRSTVKDSRFLVYLAYSFDKAGILREALYLDDEMGRIVVPEMDKDGRFLVNLSDEALDVLSGEASDHGQKWPEKGIDFNGGADRLFIKISRRQKNA